MAANSWPVPCYIGAVIFDPPPDNDDAAVVAADRLMYRGAKPSGKSAVRVAPFLAQQSPTLGNDSLASGGSPG